ncbi:MAG: RNA methyltransferase [Alphaproteobacteria bacterium]
MAKTPRPRKPKPLDGLDPGPAIILVHPQLGENIGAAARAMLNCGLGELRLVKPKNGWPSEYAIKAATGAVSVIEAAIVFETTAEAIADLGVVYAATARRRDMTKTILTPRIAAASMRRQIDDANRVGILFGPERTGLHNDDISLAEAIIEAPLNPDFASLNLGQAVLLVAYEWRMSANAGASVASETPMPNTRRANRDEMAGLFDHLEGELDDCGFLLPIEKRPSMVRSLRNLFQRAGLTEQEVRTLRGVIAGLTSWHKGTKRGR